MISQHKQEEVSLDSLLTNRDSGEKLDSRFRFFFPCRCKPHANIHMTRSGSDWLVFHQVYIEPEKQIGVLVYQPEPLDFVRLY